MTINVNKESNEKVQIRDCLPLFYIVLGISAVATLIYFAGFHPGKPPVVNAIYYKYCNPFDSVTVISVKNEYVQYLDGPYSSSRTQKRFNEIYTISSECE